MGIEPTSLAWEAGILPMNYARICMIHYTKIAGDCQIVGGILAAQARARRRFSEFTAKFNLARRAFLLPTGDGCFII